MKPIEWTPDQDALIRREYARGANDDYIADKLGVCVSTVFTRRKMLGCVRQPVNDGPWSDAEDALIRDHAAQAFPCRLTAKTLNRRARDVDRRKIELGLNKRDGVRHESGYDGWCPTPEQIAKTCAEIQATWTDDERESRKIGRKQRVKLVEFVSEVRNNNTLLRAYE